MGTCEYCGQATFTDYVNTRVTGRVVRWLERHDDERALTVEACPMRPGRGVR